MSKKRLGLFGVIGALLVASVAFASGIYTNGFPVITATTVNGTLQSAPNGIYTQLGATTPLIPVDTQLANGQAPQTVAASPFQTSVYALEAQKNTATSTAAAATLNTRAGLITTESLSTAVGSTYTFTLTNSLITTTSNSTPQVAIMSAGNTAATTMQLVSSTAAAGSIVFVWKNVGANALNGTMLIAFHI